MKYGLFLFAPAATPGQGADAQSLMTPLGSILPLLAVLLTGCGNHPSVRAARPESPAVPVRTVAVSTEPWPSTYEAAGTVRARSTATISSKVMSYVQQVDFQLGDRVREAQVLVSLDARDLEADLRRAEAGREEDRSAVTEMENALAAARAKLDLAQATFKRMDDLAAKKSISNQEFDEAAARLKTAQANYEMARARRTQLDSQMARAEQEVRAAAIVRDYASITAPFAGIVTAKSVEPGTLATPGAPLLAIERNGGYRLEASVDESKLPIVKVGQDVEVTLDAANRAFSARVSEIVPSVDFASRSYTVKIDLPALPQLRSEVFGRAIFRLSARKVVAIPASALIERGQLQSVFVVEDNLARTRLVTTGRRSGQFVRSPVRPEPRRNHRRAGSGNLAGRRRAGGPAMSDFGTLEGVPGARQPLCQGLDLL
jgi:RND family efflux transporter MFP subunit